MAGIGGCPNGGGNRIGCTMPGFPDMFMPFMNQPPGSPLSSMAVMACGRADPYGRDARIIGEVKAEPKGIVAMRTGFGGRAHRGHACRRATAADMLQLSVVSRQSFVRPGLSD
jgi:hypothetical protein